jgi:membrane-associated phospholipid phosphatase
MRAWWIALGSFGALIALTVSVRLRLLNTFDSMVRSWARPHDVWGTVQVEADLVVEGLRPAVLAALLAAFTVVCCVRRRSLRPAVFVAGVSLATVALTVATKAAVARPDPHGLIWPDGGSFPSGHTIAVLVSVGMVVLLAQRPRPWVWLLVALAGCLMGACLLVQAAHWSTDIVGGGLLASTVLAFAAASGWSRWSHGHRETTKNSRSEASNVTHRLRSSVRTHGNVRDSRRSAHAGQDSYPTSLDSFAGRLLSHNRNRGRCS